MDWLSRILGRWTFRWRLLCQPLSTSVVDTQLADRTFQLLDLLFVLDLYEYLSNLLSPHLRPLTAREVALLRPIFGSSIPYQRVRLDERARFGPRKYRFCYVSFHTINSWGPIDDATLVHELVHVWQYQHVGACYIPRALAAQRTADGYDYGGVSGLRSRGRLTDFNYEQMASVIEDSYRLRAGLGTRYVDGLTDPAEFGRFLEQLRRPQ